MYKFVVAGKEVEAYRVIGSRREIEGTQRANDHLEWVTKLTDLDGGSVWLSHGQPSGELMDEATVYSSYKPGDTVIACHPSQVKNRAKVLGHNLKLACEQAKTPVWIVYIADGDNTILCVVASEGLPGIDRRLLVEQARKQLA